MMINFFPHIIINDYSFADLSDYNASYLTVNIERTKKKIYSFTSDLYL